MGQQQALIVVVGVLVISIAIATGYSMFASSQSQSQKLAIVNDVTMLASKAVEYRSRPVHLGGGQQSYNGFRAPARMMSTENAAMSLTISPDHILIDAVSTLKSSNKLSVTLNQQGELVGWSFEGDFQ